MATTSGTRESNLVRIDRLHAGRSRLRLRGSRRQVRHDASHAGVGREWKAVVLSVVMVGLTILASAPPQDHPPQSGSARLAVAAFGATTSDTGATILAEAESSLAKGEGPAGGLPMTCSATVGGGSCSTVKPASAQMSSLGSGAALAPRFPHRAIPASRYGASIAEFYNGSGAGILPQVLLFGGANSTGYLFNDTWQYTGPGANHGPGGWWNVTPYMHCTRSTCPEARHDAMMTYDSETGYDVLFGGCGVPSPSWVQGVPGCGSASSDYLSDTWAYSDPLGGVGNWTNLSNGNHPSARMAAGFADDPARGYVLLFGGCGQICPLDDTWKFQNGTWHGLNVGSPPPARYGMAMADAYGPTSTNVVVLFGGCGISDPGCRTSNGSSGALGDVWEFGGVYWTQQTFPCTPSVPCPSPRYFAASYPFFGWLTVFGGAGSGGVVLGNATDPGGGWWVFWSNSTSPRWKEVDSPTPPMASAVNPFGAAEPRYDGGLAWASDDQPILFGGSSESGSSLGDMWTWTYSYTMGAPKIALLSPTLVPSPQYGGDLVFDPHPNGNFPEQYSVLFGGCGAQCANSSTWTYTAANSSLQPWNSTLPGITPANSPSGRMNASMVYFNDTNQSVQDVILFGGLATNGTLLNDTWEFSYGRWSLALIENDHSPSPRRSAAFAYNDSAGGGYAVLFGGCGSTCPLDDTWELSYAGHLGFRWQSMTTSLGSTPPARYGASMVYDAADSRIVLFGGCGSTCPLGDTWNYTSSPVPGWNECRSCVGSNAPSPRWGSSMAYDSNDRYVLLFGGCGSTCPLGDTWKYGNGTWTELSPATSPPARFAAPITYDGSGGYIFLVGGVGTRGIVYGGIGWAFQGGDWYTGNVSNAMPRTQAPPSEYGASIAVDPDPSDGYALLFGGCQSTGGTACSGATHFASTWEYVNGQWEQVSGPQPPARWDASLVFDSAFNYFLLVGGCSVGYTWCSPATVLNDVWTFSGGNWLSNGLFPGQARGDASIAYDIASSEVVLFGGIGCGSVCGDSWVYKFGSWAQVGGPLPAAVAGAAMAYDANPALQYVVMVGGRLSNGTISPDVYEFNGTKSQWTLLSRSPGFTNRYDASLTYDALDGYLVLFGGATTSGAPLSDAWEYTQAGWARLAASTSIGPRWGMAMVFDGVAGPNGFTLMYGGNPSYDLSFAVAPLAPGQGDTWHYLGDGVPPGFS